MSGLYNILFGQNDDAQKLMAVLAHANGTETFDAPRFRDCYFNGEYIVVHTRTGGGNRDFYESEESCRDAHPDYFTGTDDPTGPWNSDLRAHPWFVRDEDDDFDCTYADFYFKPTPEVAAALTVTTDTPADRWQALFEALKVPSNG